MTNQYVRVNDSIFRLSDIRRIKLGHSGAWIWVDKHKEPICLSQDEVDKLLPMLEIKDLRKKEN